MKMRSIFIVIASCTFPINILAQANVKPVSSRNIAALQQSSSEIKELNIGDVVPDVAMQMMNYSSPSAKLSDFKGKLIILDFWATWCGSCIDAFPKMDSLQKILGDKLQVILVNSVETKDSETMIDKFFKKWKERYGRTLDIPTIVNDSVVTRLFRHSAMPHYAWIGPDGLVKAITDAKSVTKENIYEVINSRKASFQRKIDFLNERFMFLGDDVNIDSLSNFSFFIKGELKGLQSISNVRVSEYPGNGLIIRGVAMRNRPLLEIYQGALRFDKSFKNYNVAIRTILEVENPADILPIPRHSNIKSTLYSYDVIVPISSAGNLSSIILSDINHNSAYFGRIEKKEVECFVFTVKKKDHKKYPTSLLQQQVDPTQDQEGILEVDMTDLVASLNAEHPNVGLPVVDETKYTGVLKISEPALHDIEKLAKELSPYGISIIKVVRRVDMFVISDKK